MVESFKRYYNNSFLDGQRQEAYNLFLGNYIFAQGQPMLWNLSTDYYLHHAHPRMWSGKTHRSYVNWYTPSHLMRRRMPPAVRPTQVRKTDVARYCEDYWLEYYRPLALSSFLKIFSYRMNSTLRYLPFKSTQAGQFDLSPFRPRTGQGNGSPDKGRIKKGVTIVEPSIEKAKGELEQPVKLITPGCVQLDRSSAQERHHIQNEGLLESGLQLGYGLKTPQELPKTALSLKDKAAVTHWTLNHFISNSLNPSVAYSEMAEYGRYMSHPLDFPLVVANEINPTQHVEFLNYIEGPSRFSNITTHASEEDLAEFAEFVDIEVEPLTVFEADLPMKRYKAYGQWLRGKSLFKQSVIEN